MTLDIPELILKNLYTNDVFSNAVLPHIKEEYFENQEERHVFNAIRNYISKYLKLPKRDIVLLDLETNPDVFSETLEFFEKTFLDNEQIDNTTWLIDQAEIYCKDRALYNALEEVLVLAQDKETKNHLSRSSIPSLMQDALSVSFDTDIGYDYVDDVDKQYEFYTKEENKIRFDLTEFNKFTHGGLTPSTLTVLLASTGVGKSLALCHCAAGWLMQGKKVLYISLEMSEGELGERIDANVLDTDISLFKGIDRNRYYNMAKKLREKNLGDIIFKRYPTGQGHVGHFRHLLGELRDKKQYIPDVIIVDYLNICAMSRPLRTSGMYEYVRLIAEELRGLGIEYNVPMVTATQSNREGAKNPESMSLTNIAESFGTAMTGDIIIALITSDELDEMGHLIAKVLKNRRGKTGTTHKIGITKSKMRLYDIPQEDTPTTDDIDVQPNRFKSGHKSFQDRMNKFKDFTI